MRLGKRSLDCLQQGFDLFERPPLFVLSALVDQELFTLRELDLILQLVLLDRAFFFDRERASFERRFVGGLLNLFAREVAQAREVKCVPAYFPFTEPSVELHVKHPQLGWMELGGAGLFRPEVTLPLGVEVPVIAWGLGLDRMAMIALGIHDIRELFTTDLDLIRTMRRKF